MCLLGEGDPCSFRQEPWGPTARLFSNFPRRFQLIRDVIVQRRFAPEKPCRPMQVHNTSTLIEGGKKDEFSVFIFPMRKCLFYKESPTIDYK